MPDPSRVRYLDRSTPPHLSTLIILAGVSALAMNIFLPSLPGMTAYFSTDYGIMQLSVALYLGFNALLQLVIGPISDRFGRRPVVLTGIALFMLATLGCLFATTVEVFLVFRMAQAAIVVGMVLSRAVVRDLVSQDQAASMLGYLTMGMSVVPMIGPAIGGLLDDAFGWHANFWLLLAFGALLAVLVFLDMGETAPRKDASFRDQIRDYPDLLTSPRFWGYNLAAAFCSGAFFAYLGGAPYVGAEVFGLTPSQLGVYFGAPAIGYFVGNWISGRYSMRFGINNMILWGATLCACGMLTQLLVFSLGVQSAFIFFAFMTFVGLGNGMVIPNATSGMLSVRPQLAGTASGLGGSMMLGGGAALSAFAGVALGTGGTAFPLIYIMCATSLAAVGAILFVRYRDAQLAAAATR
ncbi:MAG: multidrug effflux MFS transporter [Rhodobacteraceae bacterium]|nr:multidrug effflux MFS transporter [Paracoccaceae bacterium]